MNKKVNISIFREEDMYISTCLELDISSQGYTVEEAKNNLIEAIDLFYEHASSKEIKEKFKKTTLHCASLLI